MKLGCIAQAAVIVCSIAAGLGYFSFWWIAIPAFFAGSLELSNGPSYDLVIRANNEGRFAVFPMMLAVNILPWAGVSAALYWIAKWLA